MSRMSGVEKVLKKYGSDTVRKMKKLAVSKIEGAAANNSASSSGKNSNKGKKIKHIVDKMLFNYRNIGAW